MRTLESYKEEIKATAKLLDKIKKEDDYFAPWIEDIKIKYDGLEYDNLFSLFHQLIKLRENHKIVSSVVIEIMGEDYLWSSWYHFSQCMMRIRFSLATEFAAF